MHSMIYFGFLALLGVTTALEVDHQMPESAKFLHGKTYLAYSLFGDIAGVVFMVGIVWAILRRLARSPTFPESIFDQRPSPMHRSGRTCRGSPRTPAWS